MDVGCVPGEWRQREEVLIVLTTVLKHPSTPEPRIVFFTPTVLKIVMHNAIM